MKTSFYLILLLATTSIISCSKTSSNSGSSSGAYNNATGLMPLAVNNAWNYKLKEYNPATGAVTDSTNFTLTVVGQTTANGITYFKLQRSLDNSILWFTNINSTTLGSIDSVSGVNYYKAFISGTGDSTVSTSSWPAPAGTGCTGTEKLYSYYKDTTLTDLEGNIYTNSIKNDAVIFNCSDSKYEAQVYFVQQGVGLVRYTQYTYTSNGTRELVLVWLLQSYSLVH